MGLIRPDLKEAAAFLADLEPAADGLPLYFEGPVDMEGKEPQIEALGTLRRELRRLGSGVKIVADDWCNTLEALKDWFKKVQFSTKTPSLSV